MAKFLAWIVLAGAAMAQPAGSISGVVSDSLTLTPLAGVRVQMDRQSITTDAQGRFAFENVEPGRHWVTATEERHAARGYVPVLVTSGKELSGVVLNLKLGGTISGRVVDDNGEPVAGASVLLLERRFEAGAIAYGPVMTVSANKDGEYRMEPVAAERGYAIMARSRAFATTYYPETLILTPKADRQQVNIRMTTARTHCASGAVELRKDAPPVVTIVERAPLFGGATFAPAPVKFDGEGKFQACGLHPGEYQLAVKAEGDTGLSTVVIGDRDVTGIQLAARPPVTITIDATWDPPPREKPDQSRFEIALRRYVEAEWHADEPGKYQGRALMGRRAEQVAIPGTFTIGRVSPGEYQLYVSYLPRGCYLKEGDGPVVVTGGAATRIRMVIACDGGFLTARVVDKAGNPVSDVTLYAIPSAASTPEVASDQMQWGQVEKGWASLRDPLPPGKYLVLATNVEYDGTLDPFLKLWGARSKAKEVEIGPNAMVQVTLEMDRDLLEN